MMTVNSIDEIKEAGFEGFKRMRELFADSSSIPKVGGVYLILRPDLTPPKFLSVGTGGHFKGKNPNLSTPLLQQEWVSDVIVVYIGKATSLRTRLRKYFKFGQRENVDHWGGRLIWQLKNSADLIVCWKRLPNDDPKAIESQLIKNFITEFHRLPFANLRT